MRSTFHLSARASSTISAGAAGGVHVNPSGFVTCAACVNSRLLTWLLIGVLLAAEVRGRMAVELEVALMTELSVAFILDTAILLAVFGETGSLFGNISDADAEYTIAKTIKRDRNLTAKAVLKCPICSEPLREFLS